MICPKCQYQRQPGDAQVHPGICPACGIAYGKYRATPERDDIGEEPAEETASFGRRLLDTLMALPEQTDPLVFWSQAALLAVFTLWGASFILGGVDWQSIGGSFLHNVNLPFHEFGHVLFSPFGRFMAILGGSLFQVVVPLVFVIAFSFFKGDNFAAAICLWWCGQNFIDLSPYIADAGRRQLPLILGMSEDNHDWGNLLTMTNSLDRAELLANISFTLGSLVMVLGLYWAGYLLLQQRQRLS